MSEMPAARWKSILPIPTTLASLLTPFDDLFDRIGLVAFDVTQIAPTAGASLPAEPLMTEEEWLARLTPVEDDVVFPAPPFAPPELVSEPVAAWNMGSRTLSYTLRAFSDVVIDLPGLDGVSLVLNPGGFTAALTLDQEGFRLSVTASVALRLAPELLRPVRAVDEGGRVRFEPDTARAYTQIELALTTVTFDSDGNLDVVVVGPELHLAQPVQIGDSSVVVESADVVLSLSGSGPRPEGTPDGWRGLLIQSAALRIPDLFSGAITATGLGIGAGGVCGTIAVSPALSYDAARTPRFQGDLAGKVFGIEGGLADVALTFQQNLPVAGQIRARLLLRFFDADQPLDLDVRVGTTGLAATLAGGAPLATFSRPDVFDLALESIGIEFGGSGFVARVSGRLTPAFGEIRWPTFDVKELAIDSEGNVHLDGGWLDLPSQYGVDLGGFRLEATRLGLGRTESGARWIGLSGSVHLVEGLPAAASVDGLRITWTDDAVDLSFDGLGVELEVPGVFGFRGAVSYASTPAGTQFSGDIALRLEALRMSVDARLVIGRRDGETYFAVYLSADLPSGIPLFATGLSLYGLSGLFALRMAPDRQADEEWYEGWYKRPAAGATDFSKWTYRHGSLALGAGATIGTTSDNGYAFNGRLLFVIVFPGPILLLEGKANLMKARAKLDDAADPTFRALALLDNREGTLTVGLDAAYKHGSGGELIDLRGSAEAFFDFEDASLWHIYLGEKDPPEKRVRARFVKLFDADSYFMLDAHGVALGSRISYEKSWRFGPLAVSFAAEEHGDAALSWRPTHLAGEIGVHGAAELSVWGFGCSLTVDASIAADVFDPFHLLGEFSVGIGLPWPLPDFDVDISLEWGPTPTPPALPAPLQEIVIKHPLAPTTWALGTTPESAPVVPLDGRPLLTFSRPVNDQAPVAIPPAAEERWETVGDPDSGSGPMTVRYDLDGLVLERQRGNSWELVGQIPADGGGTDALYGSWAPDVDDSGDRNACVKLMLWSKTPYDHTRHSGGSWDDWFRRAIPWYPCLPPLTDSVLCCDFDDLEPGQLLSSPWVAPAHPEIAISFTQPDPVAVTALATPIAGHARAICFGSIQGEAGESVWVELPPRTRSVDVQVSDPIGVDVTAFDAHGAPFGPFSGGTPAQPLVTVPRSGDVVYVRIKVRGRSLMSLAGVCATVGATAAEEAWRAERVEHLIEELGRWSQKGEVLAPHTTYRLTVKTSTHARGTGELAGHDFDDDHVDQRYFRTEGPPGLAALALPSGQSGEHAATGLDDLARYVLQTAPATVAAAGEPLLPRPVYRTYDVGVEFACDYVDLMYRLEQRDLGLYLYDANQRPARDPAGKLLALSTRWGDGETRTLTDAERRWITDVSNAGCSLGFDATTIPRDPALSVGGPVLAPDTLYEARLVPLLLHETFTDYAVGAVAVGPSGTLSDGNDRWRVVDEGNVNAPSRWQIEEIPVPGTPPGVRRGLLQTSNIYGGSQAGTDPVKPGTTLIRADDPGRPADHPDQPSQWTDYRLGVTLSAADDDAMGVVFRRAAAGTYYRFSMDRQRQYRRLVRVRAGVHTVLAEDAFVYQTGRDHQIAVEALGSSLAIYQDGALVFAVTDSGDAAIARGTIGLYCWGNTSTRFADVRVDDYRATAPIVYRFAFTTSRFADFSEQMHSYRDETWRIPLELGDGEAAELAVAVGQAVPVATPPEAQPRPPGEAEARAYQTLAARALGPSVSRTPAELRISRVELASDPDAGALLLVESPEPIDWRRTELNVLHAPGAVGIPDTGYGAVSGVRFLRKADGTGLFLVVPASTPLGSRLSEGCYRLRWTYRRQAADAALPVLRKAGDASPEVAVLDVPWNVVE